MVFDHYHGYDFFFCETTTDLCRGEYGYVLRLCWFKKGIWYSKQDDFVGDIEKVKLHRKVYHAEKCFFFLMFCNVPYFMHYIIFFSEIYFADMGLSYMSICLLCWQIRHAQIQFFAYTISYNIFNIISLYWCVGVFLYVGNLYVGRLRIKKNLIFINVNYLLIHFI